MPRFLTPTAISEFRAQLCIAAEQLFSEAGYEGFNMRELSKKISVSAMTPYRYFSDKSEILNVLRARAFCRLADQLDLIRTRPSPAAERNTALGRVYIQFAKDEHMYYRLMFDLSRAGNQYGLNNHPEGMRIQSIFAACVDQTSDTSQEDAESIGLMIWTALHGAVSLFLSGRISEAQLDHIAPEAVSAITSAYSKPAETFPYKLHALAHSASAQ
jgi:AcrR family transcriptional regulator